MQFLFVAQLIVMMVQPLINLVLRFLGLGIASYVGINLILDQAKEYILSQGGALIPQIAGVLGLAKIDIAINMYLAAVMTAFIMRGLNKSDGVMRKQVWRSPENGSGNF